MYLVLTTNAILTSFFTAEVEAPEDASQRPLDPRHAKAIGDYVVQNPADYVLGALTYACDEEGVFEEAIPGTGLGVLRLPLDVRLRSVDGQHRRVGLSQAIQRSRALGSEHSALLIYVEPDLAKRRQMFSDMNNTPRKVAKAINVAFDSRDPFARAVNRLAEEHPLLAGRVERMSARVQPGSAALFTLGAVHDAVKRLFVGPNGRVKDPSKYAEDAVFDRATRFFDVLNAARPELAVTTDPSLLDELRTRSILLSSTTLRAIAGAIWQAEAQGGSPPDDEELVKALRDVDFTPSSELWLKCGFVSPGKFTPNARNQEVQAATDTLTTLLLGARATNKGEASNGGW